MLRIVVVDDEQIVLDGMKMVLDTSGRDWTVVGTALDGVQGLNVIRHEKPDVVITDIKMPDMDGLEMCKIIKEEFPEMVVFVFSGYAEFNLAQKAIELGVFNYLLKPVNYEEIYAALEKAREYIEDRRRFHLEQQDLKKKLKASIPLLKEKLLGDLIHGIISANDNVFYRLRYLDFSVNNAFLATIKIDDFSLITRDYSEEDKYLLIFAVRNIIEEVCGNWCDDFYVVGDSEESTCIILNDKEDDKSFIISLCEEIRTTICKFLNRTVSIGIGRFIKSIEDLPLSFNDSLEALQGSLFKSRNITIHIDEVLKDFCPGSYSIAVEKNIISSIKYGDNQLMLKELGSFFKKLNAGSLEYAKRACFELYISLSRSLYESGVNSEEVLRGKYDVYLEISRCTSFESLFVLVKDIFTILANYINDKKQNHRSKIITEVLRYIEENYSRNISLKEAADKVYMNINYLSEIFKVETGENFTEYLKKFRVKKAIELLDRIDLKIYQIAEMVGYSDAKHFSQVFKEITGVPPKDYKLPKTTN